MLLRNGDKRESKPELCINIDRHIKQTNTHILKTNPIIVKSQYCTSNQFHGESVNKTNDSKRCNKPNEMVTHNILLPSSSMKELSTNYIPSIPPQLHSQNNFIQPMNQNVTYGLPPFFYHQQYQQMTSTAAYVNQGVHIQQNIVSTTTMISPTHNQGTDMPQIIYSSPLPIQDVIAHDNTLPTNSTQIIEAPQFYRSQSQNVIHSSTPGSDSAAVNQLSDSFKDLANNSSSNDGPLNNSCNLSVTNIHSNNHRSSFKNNLNSPFSTNLNHSSVSLPPPNLTPERGPQNNPLLSSNQYSSSILSSALQRNMSSSSTPSSQLQSSFNSDNLTPSRRMINVIEERVLIPPTGIANPIPNIMHITKKINCNSNIMRCTLNTVPTSEDLLAKTRLPLAILLHPFRDLPSLQVIRSKKIIRCRTLSCRAYINPFVSFTDQKRWKCNMCLRMNELSEDSLYNQTTGEYYDTLKRYELRLPTVEYIAPKEYSLKSTQVPIYVFLVDISANAINHLYSNTIGKILNTLEQLLDRMPGYQHAKFAIIGYDSAIHFYAIGGRRGFQEIVVSDISGPIELPVTTGIVVELQTYHDTIQELLTVLLDNVDNCPSQISSSSCLGTALLVAKQLFNNCGGRITVFNASCPTVGDGILAPRDDKSPHSLPLSPDKEFYKTLSLEFAQSQIAVDLFQLGAIACDFASLSIISRYCSGSVFYYPNLSFNISNKNNESSPETIEIAQNETQRLLTDLHRYLTRKIGFEGILRVRFSAGFNILSSHGNFFARASDLYSMANVSPDSGIAIRLGIDDNFIDSNTVFFQAALLYTSSTGERRIRVHTLCLPVSMQIDDIFRNADHQAVAGLLAKTVADRLQVSGNVIEAREALINAIIDPSVAFGKFCLSSSQRVTSLPFPFHLRLLPLFVWGLLQSKCLKVEKNSVDLSVFILNNWRNLPLSYLLVDIYPNLYNIISIVDLNSRQKQMFKLSVEQKEQEEEKMDEEGLVGRKDKEGSGGGVGDVDGGVCSSEEEEEEEEESEQSSWESEHDSNISCYNTSYKVGGGGGEVVQEEGDEEEEFWYPTQVHLTQQSLIRGGVYLLDTSTGLILLMGPDTPRTFLKLIFAVDSLADLPRQHGSIFELPDLNNACSAHLRVFVRELQVERPLGSVLFVVTGDQSVLGRAFLSQLFEDDQQNGSYNRFLQHIQKKVNSHS